MAKYSSPSDFTAVNPNYATGLGYYTTAAKVAELLQVPDFTSTTTPMHSEVGEFIKRVEDFIDEGPENQGWVISPNETIEQKNIDLTLPIKWLLND